MIRIAVFLLKLIVRGLHAACRSRADLVIENLALRQQVTALKQARPRPFLHDVDRAFWVALRGAWARWAELLVIVKPETVVDWHRRRFRRHWTKISQQNRGPGRPLVKAEVRKLIREMALNNGWGAPRIHAELVKLGFIISETSVSRYMGTNPCRTSYRSPWQNAYAERWILGARRELFGHVVIFGARHATRLALKYITYHHEDRCNLGWTRTPLMDVQ